MYLKYFISPYCCQPSSYFNKTTFIASLSFPSLIFSPSNQSAMWLPKCLKGPHKYRSDHDTPLLKILQWLYSALPCPHASLSSQLSWWCLPSTFCFQQQRTAYIQSLSFYHYHPSQLYLLTNVWSSFRLNSSATCPYKLPTPLFLFRSPGHP